MQAVPLSLYSPPLVRLLSSNHSASLSIYIPAAAAAADLSIRLCRVSTDSTDFRSYLSSGFLKLFGPSPVVDSWPPGAGCPSLSREGGRGRLSLHCLNLSCPACLAGHPSPPSSFSLQASQPFVQPSYPIRRGPPPPPPPWPPPAQG